MLQLSYLFMAVVAFTALMLGAVYRRAEVINFAVATLSWFGVTFSSFNVQVVDQGSTVATQQPVMFWFAMGLALISLGLLISSVMDWLPTPKFGTIEDTLGDQLR